MENSKEKILSTLRLIPRDLVIIVSQRENRGQYQISNQRKCPKTETFKFRMGECSAQ